MASDGENDENSTESRAALVERMVAAAQDGPDETGDPVTNELGSMNEEDALKNLTGTVRDQNDLERDITIQANAVLMEAEDKKDQNRITKLEATKHRLVLQLDKEKKRLERVAGNPYQSRNVQKEIAKLDDEIRQISSDISDFQSRINRRHQENPLDDSQQAKSKRLPGESHRDFLIRTGKITPFAKIGGPRPQGIEGQLADTILDAEEEAAAGQLEGDNEGPQSHQLLRRPGFADELEPEVPKPEVAAIKSEFSLRPRKKRRTQKESSPSDDFQPESSPESEDGMNLVWRQETEDDIVRNERRKTKAKAKAAEEENIDLSKIDDGDETYYKRRLSSWVARRSRARRARRQTDASIAESGDSDVDVDEWLKPAPDFQDQVFADGLKLPGDIYPSLFGYQKTGVQWLAELYKQGVGGIVGGKTS